jgi:hypothetical protein
LTPDERTESEERLASNPAEGVHHAARLILEQLLSQPLSRRERPKSLITMLEKMADRNEPRSWEVFHLERKPSRGAGEASS